MAGNYFFNAVCFTFKNQPHSVYTRRRLHSLLHIHIRFIDNTVPQTFVYRGFSTICSYVYLTSGKQLHLSHNGLSSRVVTIRLLSLLPSNCYLPGPIPSRTCCELGVEHEIHDRRFRLLDDRRLHTGNNGIPRPSHNLRKPRSQTSDSTCNIAPSS